MRHTATAAAAACLTMLIAGCSTSDTTTPTTSTTIAPKSSVAAAAIAQQDLLPDFVAEQDPAGVLKGGLYNLLRQPTPTSVAITGYWSQIAEDGTASKVATFAYFPRPGRWESISDRELVWSPSQSKWVETDRSETLSPGPVGSHGWPTMKAVADYGTGYYTFSSKDLSRLALKDGLESGFADEAALPRSVQDTRFSEGARAYVETHTTVDAFFTIHRVKHANGDVPQITPVYACGKPSPTCTTPAANLAVVDQQGGQFTNFAGTVRLELDGAGHAELRPLATAAVPSMSLSYRIIGGAGPKRLSFTAANTDDADRFSKAMGSSLETFAFFEYDGQVTAGFAEPANTTTTTFAGYNPIAADDLLTHWTPAMPAVLH